MLWIGVPYFQTHQNLNPDDVYESIIRFLARLHSLWRKDVGVSQDDWNAQNGVYPKMTAWKKTDYDKPVDSVDFRAPDFQIHPCRNATLCEVAKASCSQPYTLKSDMEPQTLANFSRTIYKAYLCRIQLIFEETDLDLKWFEGWLEAHQQAPSIRDGWLHIFTDVWTC